MQVRRTSKFYVYLKERPTKGHFVSRNISQRGQLFWRVHDAGKELQVEIDCRRVGIERGYSSGKRGYLKCIGPKPSFNRY